MLSKRSGNRVVEGDCGVHGTCTYTEPTMPLLKVGASFLSQVWLHGAQSQPPLHAMKRPLTSMDGSNRTSSVAGGSPALV